MLHLIYIWVKCAGVWGNIFPKKWAVFIKLYPMSKCMLLNKILPQTSKISLNLKRSCYGRPVGQGYTIDGTNIEKKFRTDITLKVCFQRKWVLVAYSAFTRFASMTMLLVVCICCRHLGWTSRKTKWWTCWERLLVVWEGAPSTRWQMVLVQSQVQCFFWEVSIYLRLMLNVIQHQLTGWLMAPSTLL